MIYDWFNSLFRLMCYLNNLTKSLQLNIYLKSYLFTLKLLFKSFIEALIYYDFISAD